MNCIAMQPSKVICNLTFLLLTIHLFSHDLAPNITLHELIIPDAHNEEETDPCGGNQTLF